MKKFLLLLLPIALLPSITACQDKAHSIVAINTSESANLFVEIEKGQFERLIDQKQSFLIEYYGNGCGHCHDLAPLLERYVANSKHTFYRFDLWSLTSEEFHELEAKYGDGIMPDGVPTLSFIKDGSLTYTVDSNKHSSYTALKKILDKHFISSNIDMVSSIDGFNAYKDVHSNYVAYTYDLNNDTSIKLSADYIIKESVAASKKNIVLLNKDVFAENFATIQTYYATTFEHFAVQVKDNEIKKTIDYQTDGDQLNDLISTL